MYTPTLYKCDAYCINDHWPIPFTQGNTDLISDKVQLSKLTLPISRFIQQSELKLGVV